MEYYSKREGTGWFDHERIHYLEQTLIEISEEDKRVLPKWRVKCVELLNAGIKEVLLVHRLENTAFEHIRSTYDGRQH